MARILDLIRQKGMKATPQRVRILEAVTATDAHMSAEEVLEAVRADLPSVSLNTVYNTLQSFEEAGLIRKLNVGEHSFRYDRNPAPHAHVVCRICGRIEDLHGEFAEAIMALRTKAAGDTGFDLSDQDLNFYGQCPECAAGTADGERRVVQHA